ncbi:MAG: hypothetical protein J6V90_02605 [Treponema sp.]|nr:hypothetical protein [Treponema sp.]
MKKVFVKISAAFLLAVSFAFFSCENAVNSNNYVGIGGYQFPEAAAVSRKVQSNLYLANGQKYLQLETVYLAGWEDVPFLSFEDVCLFISGANDRGWQCEKSGFVYKYKYNPANCTDNKGHYWPDGWDSDELCFDFLNQTVYSDDFCRVITSIVSLNNGIGVMPVVFPDYDNMTAEEMTNSLKVCPKVLRSTSTTQIKAKERTVIRLGDYGLKMFFIGGVLYIPFQPLAAIFLPIGSCSFSGTDYYFDVVSAGDDYATQRAYEFGRKNSSTRSQLMAEYNYRTLCMTFDINYSLKDHRTVVGKQNIARFNDSIFAAGLGFDLLSTDTNTYDLALGKFLMSYIDDSHTSYYAPSLYQPHSQVEYYYMHIMRDFAGPREKGMRVAESRIEELRERAGGKPGLYYVKEGGVEKMAVLAFDGFEELAPSLAPYLPTDLSELAKKSTYAFFKAAFDDIANHTDVDKVVFDLSCNGGGSVRQCVAALCFLKDCAQLYLPIRNILDNSITKFFLDVTDGSGNKLAKTGYDFYVLTSDFSFSCGNAFPAQCKWQGLAKIIGVQSGGGASVVKSTQSADGALFRTSSAMEMCALDNGNYVCIDAGVPVDLKIPFEKFYSGATLYQDLYGVIKGSGL